MGGHVEYPKPTRCRLYLYEDRIEIENSDLVVPYNAITGIENMDEKKISAKRVVGLGLVFVPLAIVGAMWKKNHIYSVIEFKDQNGLKAIILDFDDRVTDIQGWIYRMMLSCSRTTSKTYHTNGSINYENQKYGFSIKYPKSWIKDELDQREQDYATVVEFRLSIENSPPFVTVYINDVEPKHNSFQSFVDDEKKEVQHDPKSSIIEFSNLLVANVPSMRLIDVEEEGYKRMVTWIPSVNRVYEISYSNKQEQFLDHLSVAEDIIHSFKIIDAIVPTNNEQSQRANSRDDPLLILKIRFAKGEITEEEYERMRSILMHDG